MRRLIAKGKVDAGKIRTTTIMYSPDDQYWHPQSPPEDNLEDDQGAFDRSIDHDLRRKQEIEQRIADY